jgi:hypothetical protein
MRIMGTADRNFYLYLCVRLRATRIELRARQIVMRALNPTVRAPCVQLYLFCQTCVHMHADRAGACMDACRCVQVRA